MKIPNLEQPKTHNIRRIFDLIDELNAPDEEELHDELCILASKSCLMLMINKEFKKPRVIISAPEFTKDR